MGEYVIGTGSFGVVFQAVIKGTNTIVAVKRVVQDRKYKVLFSFKFFNLFLHFSMSVFHFSLEPRIASYETPKPS